MENKEENRPVGKGENKVVKQYVYIGFIGIKSCGKPICIECDVILSNEYKVTDPDHLPKMPCCLKCEGI